MENSREEVIREETNATPRGLLEQAALDQIMDTNQHPITPDQAVANYDSTRHLILHDVIVNHPEEPIHISNHNSSHIINTRTVTDINDIHTGSISYTPPPAPPPLDPAQSAEVNSEAFMILENKIDGLNKKLDVIVKELKIRNMQL